MASFQQKISIEGAQDIERALQGLAQASQRAFGQVTDSISKSNSALAQLSKSFNDVQAAAGKLGSSLGTVARNIGVPLTLSLAGATAAIVAFTRSAARMGDDLSNTAQALGFSVEALQQYRFAAAQAGVDSEKFSAAMSRFAAATVAAFDKEKKALSDVGKIIAEAMDASKMAGVIHNPFSDMAGGVKNLDELLTRIRPNLQLLQAELAKKGLSVPLDQVERTVLRLLPTSEKLRSIVAGWGADPGAKTFLEQFSRGGDEAANALEKLKVRVTDLRTGEMKPMEESLGDVAEAFKNMGESTERVRLAQQLFGRAVGGKMIPFLAEGREGVHKLIEEFKQFGLTLSGGQVKQLDDLDDAIERVGMRAKGVKGQLGTIFAPQLTRVADAFSDSIKRNWFVLRDLGEQLRMVVEPTIEDFINLLAGRPVETPWIKALIQNVKELGKAIYGAFVNILIPAFGIAKAALDEVATAFNKFFGTNLTGGELAIAGLVLAFSGLAGVILQAVSAVGTLALAFALLMRNPIILALTLTAAAVAYLWFNWDRLNKEIDEYNAKSYAQGEANAKAHNDAIKADFAAIGQWFLDLPALAGNAATNAAAAFAAGWRAVLQWFEDKLRAIRAMLPGGGGGGPDLAAALGANDIGGLAGGGVVRGPGSSTSDSILARLSRGEFVIRAAAVQHYGPQLLAALNNMRLPKFALGGLAEGLTQSLSRNFGIPGFADGGMVQAQASGRPVVINLPGGGQIGGLTATPSAVRDLMKYSVGAQNRSGGKKPSWYRG